MRDLTPRQRQTLTVIEDHVARYGASPSMREIGEAMGIKSTNGVSDHIRALRTKGYLEQPKKRAMSRGFYPAREGSPAFSRMASENALLRDAISRAQDRILLRSDAGAVVGMGSGVCQALGVALELVLSHGVPMELAMSWPEHGIEWVLEKFRNLEKGKET